jgi:peptidyl-Lys metalloendopeptidase
MRFQSWAAALALAAASAVVQAAPLQALDVRLSAVQPVLRGDVDVVVDVTVTNTARHPVNVLKWQLPQDEWEQPLFRVLHEDGTAVKYLGAIFKRTAPAANDHLKLEPGATVSYRVELTGAYDLSKNGRYTVQYLSKGGKGEVLASAPLYLWLEGRSGKSAVPAPAAVGAAAASLAYSGNCSASQQTSIAQAVTNAGTYSAGADDYLATLSSAKPRYTTWFGTYSTAGRNTAKAHFAAIRDAFANKPITVDCKCKKPNVYAYVYPTQPYKIYVCGAFWAAPATGTDSKAGTLVHEMSHFNVVAATDDWAYGQSAAKSLAISDPAKALDNADSHEYFAENSPPLN